MSDQDDIDQDLLERYRRASTTDGARPSEATRNAILENARRLAAENAKTSAFDVRRPAANWPRWRIAAGTVGVAMLGVLLMFPRYSTHPVRVTSFSQDKDASLTRGKLASTNSPASPPVSMPAEAPPPPPAQKPVPSPKLEELRNARDQVPQVAANSSAYHPKRQESDKAVQEVAPTAELQAGLSARSAAAPAATPPAPAASADSASGIASSQSLARADSLHALAGQPPAAPLVEAVHAGDAVRVDALLAEGADTSKTDPLGRTPLMLAVMADRKDLVSELLAHGADPNRADLSGATPLQKARALKYDDIAALLTSAGAR